MFRFLLGFAVTLFVLTATGCGDGHGSNIPIGGIGGDGGTGGVAHCAVICDGDDVCGVEGVEECFPECDVCIDRERYFNQLQDAWFSGFEHGVDSVVCEVDDDSVDECNADVPKGHLRKECRGNDKE